MNLFQLKILKISIFNIDIFLNIATNLYYCDKIILEDEEGLYVI